jgi:hypothetical protein
MTKSRFAKLAPMLLGASLFSFQLGAQTNFKPTCSKPSYPTPPPQSAPVIDSDCAVSGQPGQANPEIAQNSAKNNFCATGTAQPITIAQMRDFQTQAEANKAINFGGRVHPLTSQQGPATNRAQLVKIGEGTLRSLEGYVLIARQEGKEMVNCETTPPNVPASHDIHISIVGDVSQVHGNECESVVAEMSPHHRPDSWNVANLQKVAAGHNRVRLTGQLFFDSSHSPCILDGKTSPEGKAEAGDPHRSSLWEIHPIYKFEVCPTGNCAQGGWKPLDQFIK